MKCPKCGINIEKDDRFCPECGINTEHHKNAKHSSTDGVRKKRNWVIYSIIGILLLALVFASYQYYHYFKEYNNYFSKFKY